MNGLFPPSWILLVALPAVVGLAGCARTDQEAQNDVDHKLRDKRAQDSLSVISNANATWGEIDRAFEELGQLPEVKEGADFWVKIIDDPAFGPEHRGRCMVEYFRRHVKVPISVGEFGKQAPIRSWFRKETVFYAPGGSSPFDHLVTQERGCDMLAFDPEFAQTLPDIPSLRGPPFAGMCLRLSRKVFLDEFLNILRSKKADPKLTIDKIREAKRNTNLPCGGQ